MFFITRDKVNQPVGGSLEWGTNNPAFSENSARDSKINTSPLSEVTMACLLRTSPFEMTFKIQKDSDGQSTTIRLIGRIQSEQIEQLSAQITVAGQGIVLDMNEVTLVDVDVIRFLRVCENKGIEIIHCSPYIKEWMRRERIENK